MNRKEIIKLAMDIDGHMNDYPSGINLKWDTLVKIVQKAIKDEREACAKVCEKIAKEYFECFTKYDDVIDAGKKNASSECAAAIRARGEQ